MTIMTIVPKNTSYSTTFRMVKLDDVHVTSDDPIRKNLRITLHEAQPPQTILVSGAEYESLGQWTDESLNDWLVTKLGLVVVQPTVSQTIPR